MVTAGFEAPAWQIVCRRSPKRYQLTHTLGILSAFVKEFTRRFDDPSFNAKENPAAVFDKPFEVDVEVEEPAVKPEQHTVEVKVDPTAHSLNLNLNVKLIPVTLGSGLIDQAKI